MVGVASLCAIAAAHADVLVPLDSGTVALPPAPWHVVGLPGQSKPFTRFGIVPLDGQRVLRVEADRSYGNLVHPLPGDATGRWLSWRWRIKVPDERADLRVGSGDDTPAKVCVLFDMPLNAVPFLERQVLRLARARSNEPLPTATVCYVWDNHLPAGTVLDNAFTRRIRQVVLGGPAAPLDAWSDERHDVRADFLRLFNDEARAVPPIVGVAVGADADNTQDRSLAYVAEVRLEP